MNDAEVGVGSEVWLQVFRVFRVLLVKLVHITLVGGFREPTLFVQQGQYAHMLLDQIDGGLEIESKIDEFPIDTCVYIMLIFSETVFIYKIRALKLFDFRLYYGN